MLKFNPFSICGIYKDVQRPGHYLITMKLVFVVLALVQFTWSTPDNTGARDVIEEVNYEVQPPNSPSQQYQQQPQEDEVVFLVDLQTNKQDKNQVENNGVPSEMLLPPSEDSSSSYFDYEVDRKKRELEQPKKELEPIRQALKGEVEEGPHSHNYGVMKKRKKRHFCKSCGKGGGYGGGGYGGGGGYRPMYNTCNVCQQPQPNYIVKPIPIPIPIIIHKPSYPMRGCQQCNNPCQTCNRPPPPQPCTTCYRPQPRPPPCNTCGGGGYGGGGGGGSYSYSQAQSSASSYSGGYGKK